MPSRVESGGSSSSKLSVEPLSPECHLGELSTASRELVIEPLAPGSDATLAELRDPAKRPRQLDGPRPADVTSFQPEPPCPFSHCGRLGGCAYWPKTGDTF